VADWLTQDVVDAVRAHMNGDHSDDCVVICRVLGDQPSTTAAEMTGLDADAIHFRATTDSGELDVRVPFAMTLTERAQVRAEVARMYHESAAVLGLPPRHS
jgi:putative heme iron utilization protein